MVGLECHKRNIYYKIYLNLECHICHNPTLRQVWGWNSHSQKWELGVLRDSCNFRARLQRSKHLALKCFLYRWKALEESYKFYLDFIPIQGLSRELWAPKVPRVQPGIVSRLLLGSLGNKSHLNVGVVEQCKEYYMGEGGGFPQVRAMVSQVSSCCPWLVPTPRVFPKVN
jgi:hypothetical protein